MINVVDYANSHGYRLRNMHDGFPVPPSSPKRGSRRSKGYQSAKTRMDAIMCVDGYIDQYNDHYFGWFLRANTKNKFNRRLKLILKSNAAILQIGDTEAYGYVDKKDLQIILNILKPRKWRKTNKKWSQIKSSQS